MKEKNGVIITIAKYVENCEDCDNSGHYQGTFKCYADKLSYKRYPAGRDINDVEFKEGQHIPSWCPYREKRRKK